MKECSDQYYNTVILLTFTFEPSALRWLAVITRETLAVVSGLTRSFSVTRFGWTRVALECVTHVRLIRGRGAL